MSKPITPESPPAMPVVPPPLPVAPPTLPGPAGGTRVCEWCAESITEAALQCPHCHKWRRDIAEDCRDCQWSFVAACACVVLTFVCFGRAWPSFPNAPSLDDRAFRGAGDWHESSGFSVAKFLTSPSGWAVIGGVMFLCVIHMCSGTCGKEAETENGV